MPPKMGRCDLDWIIILFFIHINAFRVEKVEESTHGTILLKITTRNVKNRIKKF